MGEAGEVDGAAIVAGSEAALSGALANGGFAIGIGTTASATGQYAAALGYSAQVTVANGLALGMSSSVSGTGVSVLGEGGIVAPGAGSTDAGETSRNVVSVGNAAIGLTRAITNVAAGTVSATSTDAVNGSQLYAVEQAIGTGGGGGGGAYRPLSGGTMSGAIAMSGNAVTGLASGTIAAGSGDAVNGGQLYSTSQNVTAAQTTANNAAAIAQGRFKPWAVR